MNYMAFLIAWLKGFKHILYSKDDYMNWVQLLTWPSCIRHCCGLLPKPPDF